jgi:hypothetical protein
MMFDFIRAVRHQHCPFAIMFFLEIFATGASRLTRFECTEMGPALSLTTEPRHAETGLGRRPIDIRISRTIMKAWGSDAPALSIATQHSWRRAVDLMKTLS